MDKKNLFSSGEFAKINGINKRTLHYYNDIGLFCPAIIDENGYHYYSSFQSIQLEMILIFRKLGLSIDDIKTYTNSPSDTSFLQMIADKKKLIDKSIEQLLEAKSFLQEKQNKLELGMSAYHGKIELIELPERPILLSSPIKGIYDEEDFATATEFSLHLKKIFGLYDNFGSRISLQNLYEENYQRYDSFFAYGKDPSAPYDAILPAGTYLRAFSFGNWDKLEDIYKSILRYADTHRLTLSGYAYEEGLNEMSIQGGDDYITMITIKILESQN